MTQARPGRKNGVLVPAVVDSIFGRGALKKCTSMNATATATT